MADADEIMIEKLKEYFRKKGTPLFWCAKCKDWILESETHIHVDTSSSKSALSGMRRRGYHQR